MDSAEAEKPRRPARATASPAQQLRARQLSLTTIPAATRAVTRSARQGAAMIQPAVPRAATPPLRARRTSTTTRPPEPRATTRHARMGATTIQPGARRAASLPAGCAPSTRTTTTRAPTRAPIQSARVAVPTAARAALRRAGPTRAGTASAVPANLPRRALLIAGEPRAAATKTHSSNARTALTMMLMAILMRRTRAVPRTRAGEAAHSATATACASPMNRTQAAQATAAAQAASMAHAVRMLARRRAPLPQIVAGTPVPAVVQRATAITHHPGAERRRAATKTRSSNARTALIMMLMASLMRRTLAVPHSPAARHQQPLVVTPNTGAAGTLWVRTATVLIRPCSITTPRTEPCIPVPPRPQPAVPAPAPRAEVRDHTAEMARATAAKHPRRAGATAEAVEALEAAAMITARVAMAFAATGKILPSARATAGVVPIPRKRAATHTAAPEKPRHPARLTAGPCRELPLSGVPLDPALTRSACSRPSNHS